MAPLRSAVRVELWVMEPTEVNANHFAQLDGGLMSLATHAKPRHEFLR
jgi:hypothetical protein